MSLGISRLRNFRNLWNFAGYTVRLPALSSSYCDAPIPASLKNVHFFLSRPFNRHLMPLIEQDLSLTPLPLYKPPPSHFHFKSPFPVCGGHDFRPWVRSSSPPPAAAPPTPAALAVPAAAPPATFAVAPAALASCRRHPIHHCCHLGQSYCGLLFRCPYPEEIPHSGWPHSACPITS